MPAPPTIGIDPAPAHLLHLLVLVVRGVLRQVAAVGDAVGLGIRMGGEGEVEEEGVASGLGCVGRRHQRVLCGCAGAGAGALLSTSRRARQQVGQRQVQMGRCGRTPGAAWLVAQAPPLTLGLADEGGGHPAAGVRPAPGASERLAGVCHGTVLAACSPRHHQQRFSEPCYAVNPAMIVQSEPWPAAVRGRSPLRLLGSFRPPDLPQWM
jgi:hypothetical protein